jgi:hypothetical protein
VATAERQRSEVRDLAMMTASHSPQVLQLPTEYLPKPTSFATQYLMVRAQKDILQCNTRGTQGSHSGERLPRLETAGVEFIDENGGGPWVRVRKRQQKKV